VENVQDLKSWLCKATSTFIVNLSRQIYNHIRKGDCNALLQKFFLTTLPNRIVNNKGTSGYKSQN
jgi:hypothetical protein